MKTPDRARALCVGRFDAQAVVMAARPYFFIGACGTWAMHLLDVKEPEWAPVVQGNAITIPA